MQVWTTSLSTGPPLGRENSRVTAKPYTPTAYRKQFLARVKAARTVSDKTPLEIAQALGILKDTYLRYETRTLLPHHLVLPFCLLTGRDPSWLVTGEYFRAQPDGSAVPARKLG